MEFRPALRFDRVETWEFHVERWMDDEVPGWVPEEASTETALVALQGQLGIVLTHVWRDELPRAVRIQLLAVYDLADLGRGEPDGSGKVDDTAGYLDAIPDHVMESIALNGVSDLTPYLREALSSASARVMPEKPVPLPGQPVLSKREKAPDEDAD